MKKQRIDVSYGGGSETVLFSVREDKFFSYERDGAELHKKYGGKQYYSSRSGMSGAGYLEVEPNDNDLIEFGYYRTDARSEQKKQIVHTTDRFTIFGYAPTISHHGLDHAHPVVLTDGEKVAFIYPHEVRDTLLCWSEIEGKKFELVYFTSHGYSHYLDFQLFNSNHLSGVRATRFIDLRTARQEASDLQPNHSCLFEQKLSIIQSEMENCWLHLNLDGIFDLKWEEDPRGIQGEICYGWVGSGDGLFWKRCHNQIEAFVEIRRSEFKGGKYVVPGETAEWIDFEQNFSILEWFSKTTEEWKQHFAEKIQTKARQDYAHARQRAGVDTRTLMETHLTAKICVQDSLDCGNCLPGTEGFIKQYGIETDSDGCATVEQLLKNAKIEEMLKNFAFQKVVNYRLLRPEEALIELSEIPE